jgi:serine/threonine-protein kinase
MSPEHARGKPTDERTDIYAMGCILFKMLNGRVPFEGRVLMDVLFKQAPVPIPALASPYGELPEVLERVVARALARNVDERYANASEMRQDLDRALATMPLNERTRPR